MVSKRRRWVFARKNVVKGYVGRRGVIDESAVVGLPPWSAPGHWLSVWTGTGPVLECQLQTGQGAAVGFRGP